MDKNLENLVSDLQALDNELVDIEGNKLKPSQCYHLETEPLHMLFNTNCPDSLKEKLRAIVAKHLPLHESSSSQ